MPSLGFFHPCSKLCKTFALPILPFVGCYQVLNSSKGIFQFLERKRVDISQACRLGPITTTIAIFPKSVGSSAVIVELYHRQFIFLCSYVHSSHLCLIFFLADNSPMLFYSRNIFLMFCKHFSSFRNHYQYILPNETEIF